MCYVFFLIVFIVYNDAMIDKLSHLKIGYEVRSIHQFKFDRGGSLDLHGYIIDDNEYIANDDNETFSLNLYHCTDKQIENLNKYNSMDRLCENINKFKCLYNYEINDKNKFNEIVYSFNSAKKQWMTLIIISCSENKIYDIAKIKLISKSQKNGNGKGNQNEYLSLNEINYKFIFLYLLLIYMLLFLIYSFNLFCYRYFNVSLQTVSVFYPFLQFIHCIVQHLYWNYSSNYGISNNYYLTLCYFFNAICNFYLSFIVLLICFGFGYLYNIQNLNISFKKKIYIIIILLTIFMSCLLKNYYSFMLLINIVSYILCLQIMLKSYKNNYKLLQSQIEILESEITQIQNQHQNQNMLNKSPVKIKLNILTSFQKGIIIFIGTNISFYWMSSLLLYEYPWVNDVILNLFTTFFTTFLFYNFRMNRPFKPYFYLIDQNISVFKCSKYKHSKIKNIKYNLNFKSDMLVIENAIDYLYEKQQTDSNLIKNYTLSTPFTIDLTNQKKQQCFDENTPLLPLVK
eukprot:339158_1